MTKLAPTLLLLIAVMLAGCIVSTGRTYHEWSPTWQLGYQDTQLRDALYRVSYTGYGLAPETCFDFALLRAAEITLANNARYFDVLDEKQSTSTQSYTLPGSTVTTGQISSTGAFTANSTNYALSGSIDRPTIAIVVAIRKEGNPTNMSLDAQRIVDSLRKKHKLKE